MLALTHTRTHARPREPTFHVAMSLILATPGSGKILRVGWLVVFFFFFCNLRHIFAGHLEDEEHQERVGWVVCQSFNKPIIGAV